MLKRYLLIVPLVLGGLWLSTYHSVVYTAVFAPKFEQVRRKTYIQSESYVRGTIQDVQKLRTEYLTAEDPAVKTALAETIKQTVAGVDLNLFPSNLRSFIEGL